ncbi:MAG: putative multidrug ABC transporter permease YbhS [Phycisphaerae bacterium]|nr:putative multidrug ABC transporter permease YbhS [Phycisphaerae bacterium]
MRGFWAIFFKEFAHIRRSRSTLFFALAVPSLQLMIFGYAIEVTIRHIPMVVYDLDGRQESRRLIEALESAETFKVREQVQDQESFRRALTSGRAKVGLLIPADYSEKLLYGQQAAIQVLVDGSDSQVATTAQNTVVLLTSALSMQKARAFGEALQVAPARDPTGRLATIIDPRVRLLYNPNLESSHFFVPGLVAIILQLVLLFLTSFSIVRERELGTLEQIFVTPVGRGGLILGKLVPYSILALGELLLVLLIMVLVFGVSINGSIMLLIGLCSLFIVTVLGLGLLVSTLATTQVEGLQFAFLIMMPSILLSGFMFPRSEMPLPIYLATFCLPATYFIEILRGVILRGADLWDLWPQVLGLTACAAAILSFSIFRFRKQLD